MNEEGHIGKERWEIERALEYRGSTLPERKYWEVVRLNEALGGCMVFMETLIEPRDLLDRIEARMDTRVRDVRLIFGKNSGDIKPPNIDRLWKYG